MQRSAAGSAGGPAAGTTPGAAPGQPTGSLVEQTEPVRGALGKVRRAYLALRHGWLHLGRWATATTTRLEPLSLAARLHQKPQPEPRDWRWLRSPALLGFIAVLAIAVGGSLPDSPFKLEMAGSWFFGEPTGASASYPNAMLFVGLVMVYGGIVLLVRVWVHLLRALTARPGAPVRNLQWMLALWSLPMVVVAPMFSRDVFSYAAQGEMVSRHINPYICGPYCLGSNFFTNPVDHLWQNAPAPYGPLFLVVDGFLARVSFHHALGTVVLLRLFALAGVALCAYAVPRLARLLGRDPARALVLGVANPLVVLTLIGGGHNDAVMAGLLVTGILVARRGFPIWGIVLCAAAGAIKVPAVLGAVYIAWDWLGPGVPVRRRLGPLALAGVVTLAVFAVLTALSGLGAGWVANLTSPGTVVSWAAPATGIGMVLTSLAHLVGINVALSTVLAVTRTLGLLAAVGLGVLLLLQADRIGSVKALGLTLLAFVVLGPVVQPWYLVWGIVLLSTVATGILRTTIVVLTAISPFIGLPGGNRLVHELVAADPLAIAAVLAVVLVVFCAPLGRWSVPLSGGTAVVADPPVAEPLFPLVAAWAAADSVEQEL